MTVSPYAVACKSPLLHLAIHPRKKLLTVSADVVTIFVSWSADHYNARGLHTAGSALVGACAFMASALLPATSYQVRASPITSPLQPPNLCTRNVTAA